MKVIYYRMCMLKGDRNVCTKYMYKNIVTKSIYERYLKLDRKIKFFFCKFIAYIKHIFFFILDIYKFLLNSRYIIYFLLQ